VVTTVRVSEATRERLREVGLPSQTADEVINAALDELERRRFWDAYAVVARAGTPSEEEQAEWEAWDSARGDGLQ
jgi:hypothetical protein